MKKILAALLISVLWAGSAFAQSAPGWTWGYVPTAGEWNLWFAKKQDVFSSAPLLTGGGTMTGELVLAPGTAANAGINCGVGVAPTSPINGDIWCTSAGMYVRINSSTVGPLGAGGGGGGVTTVSVASANGFGGSVANPTTTPAITLTTSVSGLLKGNGTGVSGAVGDTDYQNPISITTTGSSGPATFSGDVLNIPQYTGGGSGTAFKQTFGSSSAGGNASFTASGSGTNLTVSAVASGYIFVGAVISGTGIPGGTYIVSQTSGTTGGTGVYVTSASTTVSGTVTETAGFTTASTTTLTLRTAPASGTAVLVYQDGAYAAQTSYSISGSTITFNAAIEATFTVEVVGLTASGGGGGGVSAVSVVNANGFNGTVANPTTTPAITISTTVTGIVKGNGTGLSPAVAGTDYQAPLTLTTSGSSGVATLVGNTLNVPNYSSATTPGGGTSDVQYASSGAFAGSAALTTNGNGKLSLTSSSTTENNTLAISATSDTSGVNIQMTGNGGTTPSKFINVTSGVFQIYNSAFAAVILSLTDAGNLTIPNVTDSALSTQGAVCNSAIGLLSTTTSGCANYVNNVAHGGTGDTSLTAYAPIFGGTTSTGNVQSGTVGTKGQALTSTGAGSLPTFQQPSYLVDAVTTCGVVADGSTDNSAAITACLATPATSQLSFPYGIIIACNVQIVNNQTAIVGVGTTLSSNLPAGSSAGGTVFKCNSTTANVFTVATSGSTTLFMQGFSCTKDVTPGAGACIGYTGSPVCGNCTFRDIFAQNQYNGFALPPATTGWLDNLFAFNNYHDGYLFDGGSSNISYSSIGVVALLNSGYGIEFSSSGGGFKTVGQWTNTLTFANGLGGIYAHASSGSINDLFFLNPTFSSDNGDCVQWNTNGGGGLVVQGGLIEQCGTGVGGSGYVGRNQSIAPSHTGNGINFAGTNGDGIVQGVHIQTAAANGIGTSSALTSIIINGNYLFYNGEISGICGGNCNAVTIGGTTTQAAVTGNVSYAGPNMAYSFYSNSGTSYVTNTGNSWAAGLSAACGGTTTVKAGNIGTGC